MLPPLNKTLFSVLALFFIGTAAFTSLDTFRGYQAEMTVLVLPLGVSQTPSEQMVENIALLPTTVSFFDALLASDERLTEFSALDEQPVNTRALRWNEMLSVERQGGSGIITYTIEANTQEEAVMLARQMAQVLFQKVGTYYDIRSDVSLRLIEGPLVRASLTSPITWIIISIGIGVVLAMGLMLLGNLLRLAIGTPRRKTVSANDDITPLSRPIETTLPSIHPDTFIPKKPTVFFSEESETRAREEKRAYNPYLITPSTQPATAPAKQSTPATETLKADQPVSLPTEELPKKIVSPLPTPMFITKAEAPSNLPFIDEATFLAQFSAATESEPETNQSTPKTETLEPVNTEQDVTTTPALPEEPTMEDYRRRLNELLKEGK